MRTVLRNKFTPTISLLRLIGDELAHGFKGGQSITLDSLRFGPKGGVQSFYRGEIYPYGIWRQKQPDGEAYEPLNKATIKFKKLDGSPTPYMALMNTHELVNGLRVNVHANRSVDIRFVNPSITAKSLKMERGGWWISKNLQVGQYDPPRMRKVYTPPREHRDIQLMAREKIHGIVMKWVHRFANGA